jgi:NitT/TauT family transport system ATP-binding protein
MPTQTNLLQLSGVSKRYAARSDGAGLALSDASLDLAPGEFVSLVGPSGCGKTTLLKIASGLIERTSGRMTFEGRVGAPPPDRMGVVFQSPVLLPWRTVLDNVMLPAQVQHRPLRDARRRAQELLELVQIPGTAASYPGELSGGMQQRVAIARALLNSPEILFMDEPFGALDAMTRETLNSELQEIHARERTTVLFVTHDISEAVFLSDRIAVMSSGPGRILALIDVALPRPRRSEDYVAEDFRTIELKVRSLLNQTRGAA